MRQWMKSLQIFIAILLIVSIARTVHSQDGGTQTITDDMVNAIAAKLYCPVAKISPWIRAALPHVPTGAMKFASSWNRA